MATPKVYWHIHHNVLMELATKPIKNRRKFIKEYKSVDEIKVRLRLLKPVRGQLPRAVIKAGAAHDKARTAYGKAGAAYDKARTAYGKAGAAYDKAWAACNKARVAHDKALKDNKDKIEALHAKECPGCSWDGKTIFPV